MAVIALLPVAGSLRAAASLPSPDGVDLSTYVRVGRYDLPEPTRTAPPPGSLLAQEVSAVTYNPVTDSLFVVGEGGRSIVQVSKTGVLIDSMTLAGGGSPQGTAFYDPEGLTYVGGGNLFVLVEERDRQASLFAYVSGGTLTRADARTVKLGTTTGNIGLEGISFDPLTNGFIAVKESGPQGIFQTEIDFSAGSATNGSPTTENSVNLFDPAAANLLDFADVFALSNLPHLSGLPQGSHLLVLSQESGRIVNVDRAGLVFSSLTIVADPGNPLSVPDQGHEGLTMDHDGNLYVVSEGGGGDIDHPQLWVYAPSLVPNQPPSGVTLNNRVTSIAENTSTATRLKVADVAVADDALGTNLLTLAGPDPAVFEVDSTGLYIKAGASLDYEARASYSVTIDVDDPTVGTTPDASAAFSLAVTDVLDESPSAPSMIISEVSPWSSGNTPYAADWFEVTNTGLSAVNVTGWRMDDNSNAFGSAVALTSVTAVAPGHSAIFIEGAAAEVTAFTATWFGGVVPFGVSIGSYSGAGVGLSTGGDAVNLFDAAGNRVTGVSFGVSTTYVTFDNTAGRGSTTLPLPAVTTLSVAGVNGAFVAGLETGSPGIHIPPPFPNQPPTSVSLTNRVTSIAENTSTAIRLKVADVVVVDDGQGTNHLSVSGPDASVFEVDSNGLYVKVGTALDFESRSSYTVNVEVDDPTVGAVPDASAVFTLTVNDVVNETPPVRALIISEVSPWSSGDSPYAGDWFEVTNTGTAAVDLTGWRVDDSSNAFVSSVALTGVSGIAPGQSVVFIEGDAARAAAFVSAWFGGSAPAGFAIGTYSGAGIGLSTGGDAVNLFDASGNRVTGVSFGASTTYFTFDNAAGLGSATLPLPTISTLSVANVNGAFRAGLETGSPGLTQQPVSVAVTRSGFVRDRRTGLFAQQLTITNSTGSALPGPLSVWLEGLSANARLVNATGAERRSILVPFTDGGVGAGVSVGVVLQFSNPSNAPITYTTRVVNGVPGP